MYFGKEERFALIILIFVLVITLTLHIILSQADKSSFATEYTNSSEEGEFVFYCATVTDLYETNTGGHLVIETEGPGIFVAEGGSLNNKVAAGDRIKFTGVVSIYNSKKEIFVDDVRDIEFF